MPDHDITLRREITDIISRCRKGGWRAIVAATAATLVLAGAYLMLRRPTYTANASVMIAGDTSVSGAAMSLVRQFSLGNILGGSGSVHDELSMLSSHTTLMGAVKATGANTIYTIRESLLSRKNAYPESPVKLLCDPAIADTLSSVLVFKLAASDYGEAHLRVRKGFRTIAEASGALPMDVETPYGKFTIVPDSSMVLPLNMTIRFTGYSRAAEELDRKLTVDIPGKLADVVSLSFESDNRFLASDMLQALIDEYNRRGIEAKRQRDTKTISFIDDRLARLTGELSDSEEGIETFKQKNRLSDLKAEAEYMLGERAAVDQELLKAETAVSVLQLTKEFIEDPANSMGLIPMLGLGESDAEAVTSYNELILQRITLEKSARPGNPALERLDTQISGMRQALKATVDRSLQNARVTAQRLSDKNRSSQARLDAVPTQERTYRDILRRQTVQEQLMVFLMEQREETSLNMVSTLGRGEIVDEPYILTLDTEASPLTVLVAAFLLGLMIMPVKWYFTSVISSTEARESR